MKKKKIKIDLTKPDLTKEDIKAIEKIPYEELDKKPLKSKKVTITTGTSVTTTTRVTLNPAGDFTEDLVIEPLGNALYVYFYNRKNKGIIRAYPVYDKPEKKKDLKYWAIKIGDQEFKLKTKPLQNLFFRVPRTEIMYKWIKGEYKSKTINEIFKNLVDFYKTSFDLTYKIDAVILSLSTIASWLRDILKAFFFIGIDATKGAGKTSLLEVMSLSGKHGCTGGDISTSFLARTIEKQKLCLYIDEIDQLPPERKKELEGILRKAQRKGNPYLRINTNTFEPEKFNVHNAHAFSFRTGVESALSERCLPTKLRVSSDKTLPVINYHKEELTYPLFEELFFYFIENIQVLSYSGGSGYEVTQLLEGLKKINIKQRREKIFKFFTRDFTKEEIELMDNLTGRNIELCYILLNIIHSLRLDFFKEIEEALTNKQREEKIPESFYLDKLNEFLVKLYEDNNMEWKLEKGEFEGCFYYPKNKVYGGFIKLLKTENISTIGTNYFNGLLKDIGWIQGLNWKNQKNLEHKSVKCLIFDSDIQNSLNLNVLKIKEERIEEDPLDKMNPGELYTIEEFIKEHNITNIWIAENKKIGLIVEIKPGYIQKI